MSFNRHFPCDDLDELIKCDVEGMKRKTGEKTKQHQRSSNNIIKCKVPDRFELTLNCFIYKRTKADYLFTSVLLANQQFNLKSNTHVIMDLLHSTTPAATL